MRRVFNMVSTFNACSATPVCELALLDIPRSQKVSYFTAQELVMRKLRGGGRG